MLLCTNCAFYSERTKACTKYWKPAVEIREDPKMCAPVKKVGLVVVAVPEVKEDPPQSM